jgi:ubiquinone/menaquinone biosynthesis C-methylase UbiE
MSNCRLAPYLITSGLCVAGGLAVARYKAAEVYDYVILKMTERWYNEVLSNVLKNGDRICDIGIGTAGALCTQANVSLVKQKKLSIVGVDYDQCYIDKAYETCQRVGILNTHVALHCRSIYESNITEDLVGQSGVALFDVVYISGSFSLNPDPQGALKVAARLLRKGGSIIITQTYQKTGSWHEKVPFLALLKPLTKYITTIDFGQLVFEPQVLEFICDAGMEVIENRTIPNSVDNGFQSARLLVLRPADSKQ